ncbi:helicase-associated domain-containing protein [Microbispora bryophytorum]|uniref:Helicase-associated domain-containing protein n=1 Tax=Microbispora bryophytorum subsp. camponoti TaxID=1677852 RepID=A0ABR8LA25_9ACTN|nr:helicase-associated domain-containing protein [Microbispora camponoti]MBD3145621.1 helicase-associated domain-containing protein [Microbispora camponoti]
MSTGRRLETWLKTKSPEDRRLILARVGFTSEDDVTPQDLARLLLQPRAALSLARLCTRPQHQALSAVAWLAAQRHGPLLNLWHDADPATRAVPRADVLDLLAGSDPALRARAAATLDALADMALVLPPHDDQVIVSTGVHAHLAESGLGRPAAELIRLHFNAPEVHAIAETLGFPKARAREGAERNVLGLLADQERVRTLLAQAPAEAREWLLDIIGHGSQVLTHAYQARGGFGYQQAPKYAFRPGGSGDPNTDWLAARGLLLPAGPYDTAEVPIEVAVAALGELRVPFVPEPPRPPAGLPDAAGADGSGQAAATAALSQIERVLAACADQPPVLRKAGGLAVRDTKRIAKAAGVADDVTRLWLDLAMQAGLLGLHAEPVQRPKGHRGKLPEPVVSLLPATDYDDWLKRSPAERLVVIIATWATIPAVYTYWPEEAGTPVALTEPEDPYAVGIRGAVFEALAALPPGKGVGADGLPYVTERAAWHRPRHFAESGAGDDLVGAVVREAESLGLVAGGALTSVGRVVRDLLLSGEAWTSPEPALAAALAAMLPPAQTTAFFQADLTAMVRGMPGQELAELLDDVADRESEGHAVVWRFSGSTVRRAFDRGQQADVLLARLAEVAEAPLPQPLEYLIKDTARTHGRVRVVRSGCCLRSDDEALVEELARSRALRALGLRKIAPTVLISGVGEEETLARLRAAGYTPALESETGVAIIERAARRRA